MWVNLLIIPKSHHPLPLTTSWYFFFPTYIYACLIKLQHPHSQALNSEAAARNFKGYRRSTMKTTELSYSSPSHSWGLGSESLSHRVTDASKASGTGMSQARERCGDNEYNNTRSSAHNINTMAAPYWRSPLTAHPRLSLNTSPVNLPLHPPLLSNTME